MYYTQVTGPGSGASTVAPPATKKTTEAKGGDTKAADAKAATTATATTTASTPAASSNPAYTISQSMESLLDAMAGKPPAKNGADSATDSADGGASSSKGGVKRAQDAQRYMQAAADQGKQLASLFGKAVDSFKSDLGSLLSGLGMSDDKVSGAVGKFGDAMNAKMANMDFSNMAMDMQTARSQWTIESRGIELKIKDGDREVSISFAKSTLDFRKDEQSVSAVFGAGGDVTKAMFGQTTTTATAKATGIIVRGAENFTSDEMKNILGKLTDMASKGGGMKGLATLSPSTDSKGVMHLNVDLSVPVDGLSGGSGAAAASSSDKAAASSAVDISA